jgi:hypothetical protein
MGGWVTAASIDGCLVQLRYGVVFSRRGREKTTGIIAYWKGEIGRSPFEVV